MPKETDNYEIFRCETCKQDTGVSREEIIAHLKEVHHMDKPQGQRIMTSHMDGRDWYATSYTWTFGEVQVSELVHLKRTHKTQLY